MRDIFEHGLMAASMLFMLVFHAWALVLLLREMRAGRRADAVRRRGDAADGDHAAASPIPPLLGSNIPPPLPPERWRDAALAPRRACLKPEQPE
jgi:hypothetical protein